jgi:hypothetical protein
VFIFFGLNFLSVCDLDEEFSDRDEENLQERGRERSVWCGEEGDEVLQKKNV